jgi:hypothetical protein
MVQPVFADGEAKHVHDMTLTNIAETVLASGLLSAAQLERLRQQIVAFANDPDTLVALPRIHPGVGRQLLPADGDAIPRGASSTRLPWPTAGSSERIGHGG